MGVKWDTVDCVLYNKEYKLIMEQLNLCLVSSEAGSKLINKGLQLAAQRSGEHNTGTRKKVFPPEVTSAMQNARRLYGLWKQAGSPKATHPLSRKYKKAGKASRTVQRQYEARIRDNKVRRIMEAALSDQRLFNTLIQEHMQSSKGLKHDDR